MTLLSLSRQSCSFLWLYLSLTPAFFYSTAVLLLFYPCSHFSFTLLAFDSTNLLLYYSVSLLFLLLLFSFVLLVFYHSFLWLYYSFILPFCECTSLLLYYSFLLLFLFFCSFTTLFFLSPYYPFALKYSWTLLFCDSTVLLLYYSFTLRCRPYIGSCSTKLSLRRIHGIWKRNLSFQAMMNSLLQVPTSKLAGFKLPGWKVASLK